MAGYGYDTSTATIRVTLPDGEIVEVTGANDGVNGYEWSARMVGNDLRLEVTVGEEVLIDGMQSDDDDEGPLGSPPPELADAWDRYQHGGEVEPWELRKLDEWRADRAEEAGY